MRAILVCFVACAAAGCSLLGNSAGVTKSKAEAPSIDGFYQGKVEVPKTADGKEDPAAKMAEAMMTMMMPTLEIKGDHFTMSMMGMPIEGNVSQEGLTATFTVEKVMGMSASEISKNGNKQMAADFDKPMVGQISQDGSRIVVSDGEKSGSGDLVFERSVSGSKSADVGEKSVSLKEEAVVGTWQLDPTFKYDLPKADTAAEKQMAESMLKNMRPELRHDNSFEMNVGFKLQGTWTRANDRLRLKMKGIAGMDMPGGKSSGEDLMVKVDGDRLVMIGTAGEPDVPLIRVN
ncbi:MAG: hypothetical protein HONBIEJF_01524 [Fimbriimonadaceae bacterium]|nr:hypothetical protein [Fimbriimonadaceae bacterium]